ncbi:MAG: peptidase M1 [Bryobacteraceae bacterium]|nr:peptidase M1 [Bryobacterales bacterium]MEB2360174.1 M1 family aminopeptidase [Bryobacterales bacterium]NUM99715.1 peptidase M1 [Bryobacteraceae bacterium]
MTRACFVGLVALMASVAPAQDTRPGIDVRHYKIEAEINPNTQSIKAVVQVQFVAVDQGLSSAVFELNNAMNVSQVVDENGTPIPASRNQQDFTIRVTLPTALEKGKASSLTFTYDGAFNGREDASPVYGIKFAAIQNDFAYLMYPARWFPVNNYTADRYTADIRVTVPVPFKVVAGGGETAEHISPDRMRYQVSFTQPSFPGSIAVVNGEPSTVSSQGVMTTLYFRTRKDMASAYGEEIGKAMTQLTSLFGLPPFANLAVVETELGAPQGYSAPGILFFSPRGIGQQVNVRLIANQTARQWWGGLLSPVNRNHIWLSNGFARYSEALYLEHLNGQAALESEMRDVYIEALTVQNLPVSQSSRLEDYSPEFWAMTAAKGAAVLNMLRYVIGDENFTRLIKEFPSEHAWKEVSTADFRMAAEKISGQDLDYFFIQWIESSGAPEFSMDYTIFRTQKGFRVMGKIAQDLDTFRMPVELRIETEGNPEEKRIEVSGTSSEFVVETFGKPKRVQIDPHNRILRFNDDVRVAVAIRRGEQFAEIGEFGEALKEYQRALDVNRNSSLAHYRVAEVFFLQNNYQSAANEFREALNGDLEPKWTEVWAHLNLGKIFDVTGQRERAVNEYTLAARTKDNTQGAQEEVQKYLKEPYQRERKNF